MASWRVTMSGSIKETKTQKPKRLVRCAGAKEQAFNHSGLARKGRTALRSDL